MIYREATIKNGQIIFNSEKIIDQNKLTSDCWLIQFNGLKACNKCEYLNKKDCGGKNIRKQLLKGKK